MFAVYQEPNGNQGPGTFPTAERCNLDFDLSPGPLIADYRLTSITFRIRGKARGLAPLPLLTIGFFWSPVRTSLKFSSTSPPIEKNKSAWRPALPFPPAMAVGRTC